MLSSATHHTYEPDLALSLYDGLQVDRPSCAIIIVTKYSMTRAVYLRQLSCLLSTEFSRFADISNRRIQRLGEPVRLTERVTNNIRLVPSIPFRFCVFIIVSSVVFTFTSVAYVGMIYRMCLGLLHVLDTAITKKIIE